MKNVIITLVLANLVLMTHAQDIGCEVRPIYQKAILSEEVLSARTISDINPGFPSSWIEKYASISVSVSDSETTTTAEGVNEKLSIDQLALLRDVELGDVVTFDIKYNPNHSSAESEVREMKFSRTIAPKTEARYPTGYEDLQMYFNKSVINLLAEEMLKDINLMSVQFSINKQGLVENVNLTQSSGNDKVDDLVMKAVNQMPAWLPAENSDGAKVSQDFMLNIGDMVGC